MTGLFTAFGVLAALRHRDATGEGQWIDAALYESAFRVMEYDDALRPAGRRARARRSPALGLAGRRLSDAGRAWIVFTAPAQHLFERLCAMIGQPGLPRDPKFASAEERPKHIPLILDLMTQWFAERPFDKAVSGSRPTTSRTRRS